MSTGEAQALRREEVDLAILGGDVASLTTAVVAARAGLRVVVCSPTEVAGQGWAEVSLMQRDRYQQIRGLLGDAAVTTYLEAAAEARAWIDDFVHADGPDVQSRPVQAGAWVVDGHEAIQLHHEAQAMRLGPVAPQFDDECELPFPVRPVLYLPDQLLIERQSYLMALVAAFRKAGGQLLESAPVVSGSTHEFVVGTTERTQITTSRVVVADGVTAPTRSLLPRGSAIHEYAVEVECERPIEQLWYGLEEHITLTPGLAPNTVIISGSPHPGSISRDSETAYGALVEFGRVNLNSGDAQRRWSRTYYASTDQLPLVGAAGVLAPFVFVLGGIDRWDVLTGTAAGLQLGRYLSGAATELPWSPVHARGGSAKAIVARLRAWLPSAR